MACFAVGVVTVGAWATAVSDQSSTPTFSCAVTPQNDSSIWQANVTVTGPTPDISGGNRIQMLTVGFYDSSGQEIGTDSAFGVISGIPAGQSLTYDDYTSYGSDSGIAPQSCEVESTFLYGGTLASESPSLSPPLIATGFRGLGLDQCGEMPRRLNYLSYRVPCRARVTARRL